MAVSSKTCSRTLSTAPWSEAINLIGHKMGKRTIAEFVENREILRALRDIGVDLAQGYGVARPRPFCAHTPACGCEVFCPHILALATSATQALVKPGALPSLGVVFPGTETTDRAVSQPLAPKTRMMTQVAISHVIFDASCRA